MEFDTSLEKPELENEEISPPQTWKEYIPWLEQRQAAAKLHSTTLQLSPEQALFLLFFSTSHSAPFPQLFKELELYTTFLKEIGLANETDASRICVSQPWEDVEDLKKDLVRNILALVPKNFLTRHLPELIKFKGQNHPPSSPQDFRSALFHGTSASNFRDLVSNDFDWKHSDESAHKGVGTGPLEQHLGANGIFFTYANPYANAYTELTLVFDKALMFEPDTLCLSTEISLETIWCSLTDHKRVFEDLNERDLRSMAPDEQQRLLLQLIQLVLLECLKRVDVMNSQIEEEDLRYRNQSEISVNPRCVKAPKYILVNLDEDELIDFIVKHSDLFDEFMFIPYTSMASAIQEFYPTEELSTVDIDFIAKRFALLVESGHVRPEDHYLRVRRY